MQKPRENQGFVISKRSLGQTLDVVLRSSVVAPAENGSSRPFSCRPTARSRRTVATRSDRNSGADRRVCVRRNRRPCVRNSCPAGGHFETAPAGRISILPGARRRLIGQDSRGDSSGARSPALALLSGHRRSESDWSAKTDGTHRRDNRQHPNNRIGGRPHDRSDCWNRSGWAARRKSTERAPWAPVGCGDRGRCRTVR